MAIKRKYLVIIPYNLSDNQRSGTWEGITCSDFVVRANDKLLLFDTMDEAQEYVKSKEQATSNYKRTVAVLAWDTGESS